MNEQPYGVPTKHWPPKMTPWWFRLASPLRRRALRKNKITEVSIQGCDQLARALDAGHGVMITPNHSFHYDSYCLLHAADSLKTPFYFMSAWQVFAVSSWFERESMQRCGCFSVDREGTDVQALKTAVQILQKEKHPLVIFPEGDIYHTNDRVTPFRDGAAAIALMASKKSNRPIDVLPVALKKWYVEDPTPSLLRVIGNIEQRMHLSSNNKMTLVQRIVKAGEAIISLKESELLGETQPGDLSSRIRNLLYRILEEVEHRYQLEPRSAFPPERIKEIRRSIILLQQQKQTEATTAERQTWGRDMQLMFFATQLFSYPGDYLLEESSLERIAETVDKLEEDILDSAYPTVHAESQVAVQFGAPIPVPGPQDKRPSAAILTSQIETCVQGLLHQMVTSREAATFSD